MRAGGKKRPSCTFSQIHDHWMTYSDRSVFALSQRCWSKYRGARNWKMKMVRVEFDVSLTTGDNRYCIELVEIWLRLVVWGNSLYGNNFSRFSAILCKPMSFDLNAKEASLSPASCQGQDPLISF